jgi:hypothetical protein
LPFGHFAEPSHKKIIENSPAATAADGFITTPLPPRTAALIVNWLIVASIFHMLHPSRFQNWFLTSSPANVRHPPQTSPKTQQSTAKAIIRDGKQVEGLK